MDDPISSPNASDLDRRIIAGWAAIEHGDLGEARAALSDVYAVDEAHPGLPLLAAAIRRTRPKPVPWRSTLLVLIVIAGGAFVVYSMMTSPVRHVASTARATSAPASSDDEAAPVVADSVGTSGKRANGQAPAESSQTQRSQEALRSSGSDEALIRQGEKFLLANQNADGSWGDLATTDVYQRYHPTWTALDGLREHAWWGGRRSRRQLPKVLR